MIIILSRILSSSSSVASLLPALNFESTYLAGWEEITKMNAQLSNNNIINRCPCCCLYLALLTNELCRLVWPLVDESLKGLLHGVDEPLVPCETALCNIVHLVLKIQQVLHHILVFLWSTHYLSTKGLRAETDL